jgi:hypothetical protein
VVGKYLLGRLILDRIYQSQGLRELVADLVDSFDYVSVVDHGQRVVGMVGAVAGVVGAIASVVEVMANEDMVNADQIYASSMVVAVKLLTPVV